MQLFFHALKSSHFTFFSEIAIGCSHDSFFASIMLNFEKFGRQSPSAYLKSELGILKMKEIDYNRMTRCKANIALSREAW